MTTVRVRVTHRHRQSLLVSLILLPYRLAIVMLVLYWKALVLCWRGLCLLAAWIDSTVWPWVMAQVESWKSARAAKSAASSEPESSEPESLTGPPTMPQEWIVPIEPDQRVLVPPRA